MPNKSLFDNLDPASVVVRFRRKRFRLFQSLLLRIERPITILDVGGTQGFWQTMMTEGLSDIDITIVNREIEAITLPHLTSMVGDARNLRSFGDQTFDVVFSNSVIEHVGTLQDQIMMAQEIRRIGKRYFVQTPNKYFPIEPHFLFPFFQFLPTAAKIQLLRHFTLGWYQRTPDYSEARQTIERESARLLSKKEFVSLFPKALLFEERLLGLTKSFIVYDGWA